MTAPPFNIDHEQSQSSRSWTDRCPDNASDEQKLQLLLERSRHRQIPIFEYRLCSGQPAIAYQGRLLTEEEGIRTCEEIGNQLDPNIPWASEAALRIDEFKDKAEAWAEQAREQKETETQ